jgi:hypothetical protein
MKPEVIFLKELSPRFDFADDGAVDGSGSEMPVLKSDLLVCFREDEFLDDDGMRVDDLLEVYGHGCSGMKWDD